jgi:hypothetical protein
MLRLTEHTYPLEPSPEASWLSVAFRAFTRLAQRSPVRDLLIVGTGNGLDALGALEIFDLRSLTVTDLTSESLSVARENVLVHLAEVEGVELGFFAGDLFSCVPRGSRYSLVYENLPNLPATAELQLELGSVSGRFFDATDLRVPGPFGDYLLALHYRCLREAWDLVCDGGGVLTAIGGRMPEAVAFDLHRACGYVPELLAFDVKVQLEPDLVLPGYRQAEEEGDVEFVYYAADAIEVVAEKRRHGLDGRELADAVADDLRPLAMSATEAHERSRRGEPVAHSVLLIYGACSRSDRARALTGETQLMSDRSSSFELSTEDGASP